MQVASMQVASMQVHVHLKTCTLENPHTRTLAHSPNILYTIFIDMRDSTTKLLGEKL